MFVETAAAKTALYVIAGGIGYMAWSQGCKNAGFKEPIAGAIGAGVRFVGKLSSEFGSKIGETEEQKALRIQAEMAARQAYAEVLARSGLGPVPGSTPATNG